MGSRYTAMKVFHFKEKLDSLPRDVPVVLPPLHVRVKPTNACNHRCRYCAYRQSDLQLGKDMRVRDQIPPDRMRELLDDFVELGVRAVTFSGGGEPFCYPHLLESAQRLAGSPVKFAALTNGSRLEGEVAEVFARHATWLRVSMDGWDDASYARYRSVPEGEFARVVANMERFKGLGGPCCLGVSLIVDATNAGHVLEFCRRMKGVGVDNVKISPCVVSNVGAENNAYHRPVFDAVRSQVERARAELEDERFELFDSYHALAEKFEKRYRSCPYLQILPVVGADLNVYACQDKAYNLECGLLGSLAQQRFRDFWLAGKDKFFAIDPSRHCNHHCVANAKNEVIHEYLNADPEHLGFV